MFHAEQIRLFLTGQVPQLDWFIDSSVYVYLEVNPSGFTGVYSQASVRIYSFVGFEPLHLTNALKAASKTNANENKTKLIKIKQQNKEKDENNM